MIKKHNYLESKMQRDTKKEFSANRWDMFAPVPRSKRIRMLEKAWKVTYTKKSKSDIISKLPKEVLYRYAVIRAQRIYKNEFKEFFRSNLGYEITDIRRFYPENIFESHELQSLALNKGGEEDE